MQRYGLQALLFGLSLAGIVTAEDAPKGQRQLRVGEVIVVGNEATQDSVIRRMMADIYPNAVLDFAKLKAAERKLASSGLFVVDPATGTRPTISVLDRGDGGEYLDLLIELKEQYRFPVGTALQKVEAKARSLRR
jgi:outer membrane protein assembly factor BamA